MTYQEDVLPIIVVREVGHQDIANLLPSERSDCHELGSVAVRAAARSAAKAAVRELAGTEVRVCRQASGAPSLLNLDGSPSRWGVSLSHGRHVVAALVWSATDPREDT